MIVMGFDFGMKYIGVAVGQTLTKTATPITSLQVKEGIPQFEDIQLLIETWRPTQLIVGIPLNMDGTEQPITKAAIRFANRLKMKFKLPLFHVDERLSTWEAKARLHEIKQSSKKSRTEAGKLKILKNKEELKKLNAMAAAVLVEQWLSSSDAKM